jgi:uncharacterized protein YndB with AHSA1/START domain
VTNEESSSVEAAVRLDLPCERAFAWFVEGIDHWWPRENTFSGEEVAEIRLNERGWAERTPEGRWVSWGRALAWEPPGRLVLAWQLSPDTSPWSPEPDPAKASEVEIVFRADGAHRTQVALTHRAFERHGPNGADMAAAMGSPMGWPALLDAFRRFAQAEQA